VSIYTPRAFSVADEAAIARLIEDHPFATLITPGETEPHVSHVPLQHHADAGKKGVLLGHMARANPHWQHFADRVSVAVFHGPHAYVSPSWYADPAHAVPTWNYAVAHVHGVAEAMTDPAEARALLDALVARYEGGRAKPWHLQLEGRELAAMLEAIVGFRLTIERIDAKFKLSQNRSADDRERVITALRGERYAEADATADWMDRYARER
jgi:transcriptional regulator